MYELPKLTGNKRTCLFLKYKIITPHITFSISPNQQMLFTSQISTDHSNPLTWSLLLQNRSSHFTDTKRNFVTHLNILDSFQHKTNSTSFVSNPESTCTWSMTSRDDDKYRSMKDCGHSPNETYKKLSKILKRAEQAEVSANT